MRIFLASVALLAACGGGSGEPADARAVDAAIPDAYVPDADPHGPVSITVTDQGLAVPNLDIVFSDVDGSVVSHQLTDATGKATETLLPGSAVTIAGSPGVNQYIAITFGAVVPGDDLVFSFNDVAPTDVGDVSVTLPTGIPIGATHYRVDLGCVEYPTNNPALAVTGDIPSDCLGNDQTIDVLATALDASDAPVAWDYLKDVPVQPNGTNTDVALDAWQTAFDPITISLVGAPSNAIGAGLEDHWRVNGVDFTGFGGGGGPPTAGTITVAGGIPQGGFVERLQYLLFIGLGAGGSEGTHVLLVGHGGVPTSPAHNLSQLLLPSMTAATATDASGRLELGWTADGAFDAADGALIIDTWTDGATNHQWFALEPPGSTNPFQLPAMPDDLAAYRPTGSSAIAVPSVIFMEGNFIDGYDAFRQGLGFKILGPTATDVLPAGGGVLRASLGGQLPGG